MSTSRPDSPSASQHPRLHVRPRADLTYGDLASEFAAAYGLAPDEWQRLVLDDWLAERGGKWAALTCGLAVPRQNGKNGVLELRELFGMVGRGEKILHTAHEVKTAQKHFRRLKHFFGNRADDPAAKYPELNALVTQVRSVNGQEAIFLSNGGSVEVVARSKNSSRGFTVDVLVFDEAQELGEDAKEALIPTTSSAPLGNPQWIYTGTPPGPSADGEAFTRTRRDALEGKRTRISWIEWSVPEGEVDVEDRALWYATNPQLDRRRPNGVFGLQSDVAEGELGELTPSGFARERLGQWAAIDGATRLITADEWSGTAIPTAPDGIKSFGVAFSRDGSRVSLAGSRRKPDDGCHVELMDEWSGPMEAGVAKLADWLAGRWKGTARIALAGPGAVVLMNALLDRKVPRRVVHVMSTPDYLASCAMLHDGLRDKTVSHWDSPGQKALDDSVAVCDKKVRGANGAWGWQATTPDGDETPIEAISAALWASRTRKRAYSGGAVIA